MGEGILNIIQLPNYVFSEITEEMLIQCIKEILEYNE